MEYEETISILFSFSHHFTLFVGRLLSWKTGAIQDDNIVVSISVHIFFIKLRDPFSIEKHINYRDLSLRY